MDIRKFMSSKTSAAKTPSAKKSSAKPQPPVSKKSSSRGRRVKAIIEIDDDDDEDDVDLEAELQPSKISTPSRSVGSTPREGSKLASGQAVVVHDVDDDDDDGDTAMAPRSTRRKHNVEVGSKRDRSGAIAGEPAKSTIDYSAGGAGFGGVEDEVEEDGEPDAKKAKKAAQMAAFNRFKNRGGPPNAGNKELPVGKKNCLEGKVFVITGVLDSLEREECTELIKEYGGRVVSGVSKKVTHGIVGTEPGDSKMKKLKDLNTAIIDEDGLFAMISKSAPKPPPVEKSQRTKKVVTDESSGDDGAVAGKKHPEVQERTHTGELTRNRGVAKHLPSGPKADASLWVDKYRPVNIDELVANPGIYKQMSAWLSSWKSRHLHPTASNPRRTSASGSGKDEDRPALLLAGPPGIGKTTAAHAICRACGFEPHEFNASDVRNKAGVQDLASSIMLGASMTKFFTSSSKPTRSAFLSTGVRGKKSTTESESSYPNGQVLIMDEVDGMSGGDRGGSQELIKVFKLSKVPIICICNDDSSPKMRTLANHCFKLKFRRPMANQVRDRLLHIAKREGFRAVDSQTAERLANGCHGDIRQMINMLQTWRLSSSSLSYQDVKQRLDAEGKTFETISIFDLALSFFAISSPSNTLLDRMDNFFLDSDMMPLFVEENYVATGAARGSLALAADAAEAISDGDMCSKLVRVGQRWDLMPAMSVFSAVLPGALLSGGLSGQRLNFPSALGNLSKTNKFKRVTRELEMRVKAVGVSSGSARAFRLDYLPTMTMCMATPLIRAGSAGIGDVIERLDAYYLQKEDWSSVMELGVYKEKRGPLDAIPGAVKAALTREYNKGEHAASTVTDARIGAKGKQDGGDAVVRRKIAAAVGDVAVVDEDAASEEETGDAADSDVELDQFRVKTRGKKGGGAAAAKRGRGGARGGRVGRKAAASKAPRKR